MNESLEMSFEEIQELSNYDLNKCLFDAIFYPGKKILYPNVLSVMPNYAGDFNVIKDAEEMLGQEEFFMFAKKILEVTSKREFVAGLSNFTKKYGGDDTDMVMWGGAAAALHAAARQRAETLLWVLMKKTEGQL